MGDPPTAGKSNLFHVTHRNKHAVPFRERAARSFADPPRASAGPSYFTAPATAPASATCASWVPAAPETPIAPITLASAIIGKPLSTRVKRDQLLCHQYGCLSRVWDRMRRQSARARKIATTADIAVSSIINHSSEPLPESRSTPKTISIHSGHSGVAKKSNTLSIASPTSSRSRRLETLLARCDGGVIKP